MNFKETLEALREGTEDMPTCCGAQKFSKVDPNMMACKSCGTKWSKKEGGWIKAPKEDKKKPETEGGKAGKFNKTAK